MQDENLLPALEQLYPDQDFFVKKISLFFHQSTAMLFGLAMILVGFIVWSYLYLLPWFAEKAAGQIPVTMEMELGETMFENTIIHYQTNDSLTARVNDFVKAMDFRTDYPVRITVVHEDEMNAFALPGGNIIVFDKLLGKMKSKEELAALLAHEVSHIHYRHSLKSISRSLAGYLLMSLIFNDINGIAAVLADNSNMLVNLSYSRNLETEADEKAVAILKANGLDLNGLVGLFTLLQASVGSEPLQLLSTHPLTRERIAFAKASAGSQKKTSGNENLQRKWEAIEAIKLK